MSELTHGLYVGLPSYDGKVDWRTMKGLINTARLCAVKQFPFALDVIPGDCFIGKARNTIVKRFLESGLSDLMFIDADIGFELDAMKEIMRSDVDIVMGIYRTKTDTLRFPALMYDPPIQHPADPRLIKMQYGPAGFMRVRRRVFEAMIEKWPNDWCVAGETGRMYDFFPHGREGNAFWGEDINFCRRAAECNFDIWAVQGVKLDHTGPKVYESDWRIMVPVENAEAA